MITEDLARNFRWSKGDGSLVFPSGFRETRRGDGKATRVHISFSGSLNKVQPRNELERDQEGRRNFIVLRNGNARVERKNQPRREE